MLAHCGFLRQVGSQSKCFDETQRELWRDKYRLNIREYVLWSGYERVCVQASVFVFVFDHFVIKMAAFLWL